MHILHISNSYGGTAVYKNLYTQLDLLGIRQTVFVPLNANNHDRVGNQMIDFQTEGSQIIYSTALKPYHRFLYKSKINLVKKEILKYVNIENVDLIHASTQCLDGAIAYELHKQFNTPYIVAVRNTDVHTYYDKLIWRKPYFTKILLNAKLVVFISPKYKENFLKDQVPASKREDVSKKMVVIPNGVNNTFLRNRNNSERRLGDELRLIFVAAFYDGKGLIETIKAVDNLRDKGLNVSLNAIGKGLPNRPQDAEYINKVEMLAAGKDYIKLQPFKQPMEIIEEMRLADAFIMVSKPETFGLVYVEALSQKLPIIYAHDEGFDEFYQDGFVGYPAYAGNIDSIQKAIEDVLQNYDKIAMNIENLDLDKEFDWKNIGAKYLKMYNQILKKK